MQTTTGRQHPEEYGENFAENEAADVLSALNALHPQGGDIRQSDDGGSTCHEETEQDRWEQDR
jgi:hypothetical protein